MTSVIIFIDMVISGNAKVQGTVDYMADGWTVEYDGESDRDISLPARVNNYSKDIVMTNVIDGISGNKVLMFYSNHQSVKVYIGDEVRYTYGFDTNSLYGTTPGNNYNSVAVSEADNGKAIRIELKSVYKNNSKLCPEVLVGDSRACEATIIKNDMINVFLGVVIFVIGVAMVSLYLFISRVIRIDKPFVYLGIYFIILGLWAMSQFSIIYFISDEVLHMETVSYCLGALSLIILTLFWREVLSKRFENIVNIIICAGMIEYVIIVMLHIAGAVDMFESMAAIHIFFVITEAVALLFTVLDYKYIKRVGREKIVFGMVILALGQVLDILFSYFTGRINSNIFYKISTLIFMSIPISTFVSEIIDKINLARQVGNYQKIAYTDALTSVGNRAAFNTEIESIAQSDYFKYSIVNLDVNDLKKTNDKYGHDSGDSLIIIAAQAILNTFGPYGKCFRTGGDEFVALLYKVDEHTYEKLIEKMRNYLDGVKIHDKVGIKVASGYAEYRYDKDVDLYSTYKRADEKMYETKRRMKSGESKANFIKVATENTNAASLVVQNVKHDLDEHKILIDEDAYRQFIRKQENP